MTASAPVIRSRFAKLALGFSALCLLTACETLAPEQTGSLTQSIEQQYADHAPQTAEEALTSGRMLFSKGLYGLAEVQFRKGIELQHKNPELWLGLAACYDNLRRFDLADRAYAQVRRFSGLRAEVLNNEAYSQMLRGNSAKARALYQRALRVEPGNAVVARNLAELNIAQGKSLPVVR